MAPSVWHHMLPDYVMVFSMPDRQLKTSQQAATSIIIDGDNGLGPVIGTRALDIALETAAKYGTAFVACRNSQHFGALAPSP